MSTAQADGGGLRFNEGKPRYDLLPPEALDALAQHYGQAGGPPAGPPKYEERNWERGMAMCKCFASLMRHGWKWMRGEDFDAETGTHHMICVAWNAFGIFTYYARGIGIDNRPPAMRLAAVAPPEPPASIAPMQNDALPLDRGNDLAWRAGRIC